MLQTDTNQIPTASKYSKTLNTLLNIPVLGNWLNQTGLYWFIAVKKCHKIQVWGKVVGYTSSSANLFKDLTIYSQSQKFYALMPQYLFLCLYLTLFRCFCVLLHFFVQSPYLTWQLRVQRTLPKTREELEELPAHSGTHTAFLRDLLRWNPCAAASFNPSWNPSTQFSSWKRRAIDYNITTDLTQEKQNTDQDQTVGDDSVL